MLQVFDKKNFYFLYHNDKFYLQYLQIRCVFKLILFYFFLGEMISPKPPQLGKFIEIYFNKFVYLRIL